MSNICETTENYVKNSQPRQAGTQSTGTTKWATTLTFGKTLQTNSVVRSIQNPRDVRTFI